jgi:hypothetical protein
MGYDYFWTDKDSNGQRIARKHSLKPVQPIMCSAPDSDYCLHMSQSGSKYYIWNPIEGGIWEMMTSKDLVEIVTKIAKLGLKSLTVAEVHQVSSG